MSRNIKAMTTTDLERQYIETAFNFHAEGIQKRICAKKAFWSDYTLLSDALNTLEAQTIEHLLEHCPSEATPGSCRCSNDYCKGCRATLRIIRKLNSKLLPIINQ
jgi:hypothetical protein